MLPHCVNALMCTRTHTQACMFHRHPLLYNNMVVTQFQSACPVHRSLNSKIPESRSLKTCPGKDIKSSIDIIDQVVHVLVNIFERNSVSL